MKGLGRLVLATACVVTAVLPGTSAAAPRTESGRMGALLAAAGARVGSRQAVGVQSSQQIVPLAAAATFFGGAGDQRGTAVAADGGAVFVTANGPASDAYVVRYPADFAAAAAPTWSRSFDFGTQFLGITATNEGVYAGGQNYSLTNDPVGGKEAKTFLAKFAPDGSSGSGPGGSTWVTGGPGNLGPFFAYSGTEVFGDVRAAVEGGSTFVYAAGGGQPCSYFAYLVAKYDTTGHF